jgi:glycine dehydrogenase subunit 2
MLPGFRDLHPLHEVVGEQGAMELMWHLERILAEVSGLPGITLQPAAGSQGELTGLMLMRAYFADRGEERDTIITADTAHGTNPASVTMAGYKLAKVQTDARGNVDVEHLRALVDERTAGLMLTNPSTLGLFDESIEEVAEIFHDAGALLYYDGANLNAVCGISRPGDMGFDIVHFNLHKTFSQPHGGGGPGGGPLAVRDILEPFLPVPVLARADGGERFTLDYDRPRSIGKVRAFYGPFGVFVRSYAFIRAYGPALREMSEVAVLNANYLLARLAGAYELPFDRLCMHEFVLSARRLKREHGITALDVAKRLMDYGFHPPTIYFPLIVPEALMIEPTETETKETLDAFADAMLAIAREAKTEPSLLQEAPHRRPVRRLDEVKAAKRAVVKFGFEEHPDLGSEVDAEPAAVATPTGA